MPATVAYCPHNATDATASRKTTLRASLFPARPLTVQKVSSHFVRGAKPWQNKDSTTTAARNDSQSDPPPAHLLHRQDRVLLEALCAIRIRRRRPSPLALSTSTSSAGTALPPGAILIIALGVGVGRRCSPAPGLARSTGLEDLARISVLDQPVELSRLSGIRN